MTDNQKSNTVSRRKYVKLFGGSVGVTALAGCSGDGSEGGDSSSGDNGGDGGDTDTASGDGGDGGGGNEWPNEQEIRYIINYGPGGTSDTMGRIYAPAIEGQLGQDVVIENHSGGRAMIGYTEALTAEPDGYNVGAITYPSVAIRRQLGLGEDGVPYGEEKGVITYASDSPFIAARPEVEDFDDLVSRFESGEYETIAITAKGSGEHLASLTLQNEGHLPFDRVVGYGDSAPAIEAAVNGEVDAVMNPATAMTSQIEAGDLVPLLTFARSHDEYTDVPVAREHLDIDSVPGVPGLRTLIYPPETPDEIVNEMHDAAKAAVESDEVQGPADQTGLPFEYVYGPEETTQEIQNIYNVDENVLDTLRESADF